MKRSVLLVLAMVGAIATSACQPPQETPEATAREFAIALQTGNAVDLYCLKPDFDRFTQPFSIKPTDSIAIKQGASVPPPELRFPDTVQKVVVQIGNDSLPLTVWRTQDYRAFAQQEAKRLQQIKDQLGTAAAAGLQTEGPGKGEISDRKTCVLGLPN